MKEGQIEFDRALLALPNRQRTVLSNRYMRAATIRQVADMLGLEDDEVEALEGDTLAALEAAGYPLAVTTGFLLASAEQWSIDVVD